MSRVQYSILGRALDLKKALNLMGCNVTKPTVYMDLDWKDEELSMSPAMDELIERVMERRRNSVYHV